MLEIQELARKCPICMWLLIARRIKEKFEDFYVYDGLGLQEHLTGRTHTKQEIVSLITEKLFLVGISDPTED